MVGDAVGSDDTCRFGEAQRTPVGTGDDSSRLGHYQRGGSIIPRTEQVLEIEFSSTHRQIAKFGSTGSKAADIVASAKGFDDDS